MHKSNGIYQRLESMDLSHELRGYQSQPKQMAAGSTGKLGVLRLGFQMRNERSILSDLYRAAPLLVQQALYWDEDMPELPICSIISVGGGLLQGDRNLIEVKVGKGACAHIMSQGATKIHAMDANYATQFQSIEVDSGGYLEFIPDMIIPYRKSRFLSQTEITVAPDATVIYSEMMLCGRKHHKNERFEFDLVSLQNKIFRPDGRCIVSDKIMIEPESTPTRNPAIMGRFDVFSNVFVLTTPDIAGKVRARVKASFLRDSDVAHSVSSLPNESGLLFRVVSTESHTTRNAVRNFWRIVREEATGRTLSDQPYWQ